MTPGRRPATFVPAMPSDSPFETLSDDELAQWAAEIFATTSDGELKLWINRLARRYGEAAEDARPVLQREAGVLRDEVLRRLGGSR